MSQISPDDSRYLKFVGHVSKGLVNGKKGRIVTTVFGDSFGYNVRSDRQAIKAFFGQVAFYHPIQFLVVNGFDLQPNWKEEFNQLLIRAWAQGSSWLTADVQTMMDRYASKETTSLGRQIGQLLHWFGRPSVLIHPQPGVHIQDPVTLDPVLVEYLDTDEFRAVGRSVFTDELVVVKILGLLPEILTTDDVNRMHELCQRYGLEGYRSLVSRKLTMTEWATPVEWAEAAKEV